MRCERFATGLRFVDDRDRTVEIRVRDWERTRNGPAPSRPGRLQVAGRARALDLPGRPVTIEAADGRCRRRWLGRTSRLPVGRHAVRVGGTPPIDCHFVGAATLVGGPDHRVGLRFGNRRRVTLVARPRHRPPTRIVRAPRTRRGLAAALREVNAAMDPSGPERSWPTARPTPPGISLEAGVEAPPSPSYAHGVTFELPDDLASLLSTAPLAYYLGVPVEFGGGTGCRLVDARSGWRLPLSRGSALETHAARWLRRCLFLDCQVRVAGPHRAPAGAAERLQRWDLDAEELYDADLVDRLRAYASVPEGELDAAAPEWPLAVYLPATIDAAGALPYALDRLSYVATPRAGALDDGELVARALESFYRDRDADGVNVLRPFLQAARYHAWFGAGVPIDVYTSTPAIARRDHPPPAPRGDTLRVAVVVNDPDMTADIEAADLEATDARRSLDIDVTVGHGLDRSELRDLFAEPYGLVHFVGHCEPDGLACPDGTLSLGAVENAVAETFFLNACGSYEQGRALLRAGCRAGAVTYAPVLDRQAARVGRTFVRLLAAGFPFERAIGLARRRILMGKDYAVVGDGTYRLDPHRLTPPSVAIAEPRADGRVEVVLDTTPMRDPGALIAAAHASPPGYRLVGDRPSTRLSLRAFQYALADRRDPVIFDDTFYWPAELRAELDAAG